MSEFELQEKELKDKDINIKRILGLISMLPYILIGFIEPFAQKVKFDANFKSNMMYLGVLGLFYFFSKEIVQLVELFYKHKK